MLFRRSLKQILIFSQTTLYLSDRTGIPQEPYPCEQTPQTAVVYSLSMRPKLTVSNIQVSHSEKANPKVPFTKPAFSFSGRFITISLKCWTVGSAPSCAISNFFIRIRRGLFILPGSKATKRDKRDNKNFRTPSFSIFSVAGRNVLSNVHHQLQFRLWLSFHKKQANSSYNWWSVRPGRQSPPYNCLPKAPAKLTTNARSRYRIPDPGNS